MTLRELSIENIRESDVIIKKNSKRKKRNSGFTLLSAIEKIVVGLHESGLGEDETESCRDAIDYLKDRCGFNDWQAMLFSVCVDQSLDPSIMVSDIRRWIGCPMICILSHQEELDKLVEMGALIEGRPGEVPTYAVPKQIMDGLNKNIFNTDAAEAKNLRFEEFFDHLGNILDRRGNGLSFKRAYNWIEQLVKDNSHLTYCKHILSYKELKPEELVLLHFVCHRAVNLDDLYVTEDDLTGILERRSDVVNSFKMMRMGRHPLVKMDLVECRNDDGMGMPSTVTVSAAARTSLLVEANIVEEEAQSISAKELLAYDQIKSKEMYYTSKVDTEISRLTSLIQPEQFATICERLTAAGMRQGFACLFYGAPGTGKTETALQLARLTSRDIMQVNISDMRSKWVGESQKMVKGLFDRYRKAVKTSKIAPILLFNEADALLTRRNSKSVSSVDKMENAMQNIFLQEIENLEGILIATTNLTANLDAAFERRFLYKVNFEKPDAECRGKLWKSMIKDIDDSVASQLAEKYEFSGGQIENVARKHIVDTILYGPSKQPLTSLTEYCESELIPNQNRGAVVGFK